jgi:hypothetical protein
MWERVRACFRGRGAGMRTSADLRGFSMAGSLWVCDGAQAGRGGCGVSAGRAGGGGGAGRGGARAQSGGAHSPRGAS